MTGMSDDIFLEGSNKPSAQKKEEVNQPKYEEPQRVSDLAQVEEEPQENLEFPCGEKIEKGDEFEICKFENYKYIRQNTVAKN